MATVAELVLEVRADGVERTDAQLSRLGSTLQTLGGLASNLAALGAAGYVFGRTLSAIAQIPFASAVEGMRSQLVALTGSEQAATDALVRLIAIARETRFDLRDVTQFANILIGLGVSAEDTAREVAQLMDLMAAMGVSRADFARVAFNLAQIRAGGATAVDVREMIRAMPAIGTVLGRAVGAERPLAPSEIGALLQERGSEEFYRLLLSAARNFEGASRRLAIADVLANLQESIAYAMLPTAELIGSVMRRFLTTVLDPLLKGFASLNRALAGIPGLLIALAGASVAASASLQFLSRAGVFAGIGQLLGLLGMLRGLGIAGIWAGVLRFLAALGRLGAVGALLGRLALRVGVIGLLFEGLMRLLAGVAGRAGNPRLGEQLRTLGIAGGLGATIGAAIGSVIPVIGTALGAVLGLAIGSIVGLIKILLGGRDENQRAVRTASQQTARNTAQMASALNDIRVRIIGGGERARYAATQYEIEAYLQRLAAQGL